MPENAGDNVLAFLASVGTDWAIGILNHVDELKKELESHRRTSVRGGEELDALRREFEAENESSKQAREGAEAFQVIRGPFDKLLARKVARTHLRPYFEAWLSVLAENVKSKYYKNHGGLRASAAVAHVLCMLHWGGLKKFEKIRQEEEQTREDLVAEREAACRIQKEAEDRMLRQKEFIDRQTAEIVQFRTTISEMEMANTDLRGANKMVQASLDALNEKYLDQTKKLEDSTQEVAHLKVEVKELSTNLDASMELSESLSAKVAEWKQKADGHETVDNTIVSLQRETRDLKETIQTLRNQLRDENGKRQRAECKLSRSKRVLTLERQFLPLVHKVKDIPVGHDACIRGQSR